MGAHATIIGGSNAKRRLLCLGSMHAEKTIPAGETNYAAAEGTVCHTVMEDLLTGQIETVDERENDVVTVDGHDVEISRALLAEKLEPAIDAWKVILLRCPPDGDIVVEPQVRYTDGAWGYTDVIWRDQAGWINVLDWKFGRQTVNVRDNYQLKFYAGAALFGDTQDPRLLQLRAQPPKGVRLIVVQPLCNPSFSELEVEVGDIERFANWVLESIPKMLDPGAPRQAGLWCGYCRAKAVCEMYIGRIVTEVERPPDWETLDGTALALRRKFRNMAAEYVKAYDEMEKRALMNGVEVPFRKLVHGRGRWVWPKDTHEELERVLGEQAFEARKLKSYSALQKELRGATGKALFERIASLAEKQEGGLTVVDEDDSRPSAAPHSPQKMADMAKLFDSLLD